MMAEDTYVESAESNRKTREMVKRRISEILHKALQNDDEYVAPQGYRRWGRIERDMRDAIDKPYVNWTTEDIFRELERRGYVMMPAAKHDAE
jgi:hypothetical protein